MQRTVPEQRRPPERRRPEGRAQADEMRQMVLLLETAEVLEVRAHRTADPRQVAVLRRRAEQRRREAAVLRARLAAKGAALSRPVRLR
jgi:hypothetical protein